MFKIVQFRIFHEEILAFRPDDYKRIRECTDLRMDGDYVLTSPMSTTSALYFTLEQAMRSLFGDPSHLRFDLSDGYRLLRTTAPKAYDYDYVIEIGTMQGEFKPERLVAIPVDSVKYQSGRYSSGLHTPIACD